MNEFHQTIMGRRFIEGTMPRIADALERISNKLEAPKPTVGNPTQVKARKAKIKMADEVIRDLNSLRDGENDSLGDILFSAVAVIEALKEELK